MKTFPDGRATLPGIFIRLPRCILVLAGLLVSTAVMAEARLESFCLEDDDYRPQLPDAQGELHSRVFPGLRLPVAPLLHASVLNGT